MIQYPLSQKQDIGNVLPPMINRTFGGVNTYDPLMIEETYFTDSSNVCSDDFPALSTRPGFSVLGQFGTEVLGLSFWKSEIHVICNDGLWRKYAGGSWTTLASGISTTEPWTFTVFEGNLDNINLVGCNGIVTKRYDGVSVVDLTGAPTGLRYITTYSNRLWGAVGKELHSCALDQPTEWTLFEGTGEDSYVKNMESNRGEDINMLSSSLTKLTIGMKNSIHELYGELPSNFAVRLVTDEVGVFNNRAVTTQAGLMRLMDENALYEYGGGTLPEDDFGQIIQKFLGNDVLSCAGSDANRLYFKVSANRVMIFDSRTGVTAWNKWEGFDPRVFATLDNKVYVGDSLGRVLQLGGTTDGGVPINWYAVTKPFTNASIAQRMRWYKLWVMAELAPGSTFKVELSKSINGNDWETMTNITGTGNDAPNRILVPVAKYALENYIRIRFSGTGWMRLHEYTRQQRQLPLY